MKYSIVYITAIVAVNWLFTVVPSIGVFQPISVVVGAIFVLRDFAQREIGHRVWVAMLIGGVISYWMADPFVAAASVVAFMISEDIDWSAYTFTGRSLADRILLSSAISTPIDSSVFLGMIGFLDWVSFAVMTISKMVAALFIWWRIR